MLFTKECSSARKENPVCKFTERFTNLLVPVTQTVSISQGIPHKVPHHCVLLLQPTEAPQVSGNAQTTRAHEKSQ